MIKTDNSNTDKKEFKFVDEYIKSFPIEVQSILEKLRSIITTLVPRAQESISYGMPAYKINGKPLVYFAGYKKHIGLYALPTTHESFKNELSKYKQGKGSVQFPLKQPMPFTLIEKIIRFRVAENS